MVSSAVCCFFMLKCKKCTFHAKTVFCYYFPNGRFYPLPFPTTSQSNARAVTTHALKERMKEMSERIEAMDQITQNMDREFKSSRVVSLLYIKMYYNVL